MTNNIIAMTNNIIAMTNEQKHFLMWQKMPKDFDITLKITIIEELFGWQEARVMNQYNYCYDIIYRSVFNIISEFVFI